MDKQTREKLKRQVCEIYRRKRMWVRKAEAIVRELAKKYRKSERTVWRWIKSEVL